MKVEGVVLKSKNLGDRLRQISIYSDKLGKVNLIFKYGLSEFPLKYEPFSISEFEVIQKRDRWELKGSRLIRENFPKSREELLFRSRISRLIYPYELQPSRRLFELIKTYISQREHLELSYVAFLSKFLFIEGIFPRIWRCVECGSPNLSGFSLKKGGVVCKKCRGREDFNWNREMSLQLKEITKNPLKKLKERNFSRLSDIGRVLEKHAQFRLNS